jgi:molecular chaperone DnaJ
MFEGIFEMFGKKPKKASGRDLRYTLEVTFEEAAFGVTKNIKFPTRKECGACAGVGGTGAKTCTACGGRGEVRVQQGFFTIPRSCNACQGRGKTVTAACEKCEGSGLLRVEREFAVKIPPGTEDGAVRRVAREGEPGRAGGAPGDLQVLVRVAEHSLFKRDGFDVETEMPISFSQAALGAQVDVPTLEGRVKMRIPSGTQSGRLFRLRGKGIPRGEGKARGDQHVRVVVETPTSLTPRQRQLLEELAKEGGEMIAYPRKKNFLEKVRELFDV